MVQAPYLGTGFAPLVHSAVNQILAERDPDTASIRTRIYHAVGGRQAKRVEEPALKDHAICVRGVCGKLQWNQAVPLPEEGTGRQWSVGSWAQVTFSDVEFGLHTPPEQNDIHVISDGAKWFGEKRIHFSLTAANMRKILQKIPQGLVDELFESASNAMKQNEAVMAASKQQRYEDSLEGVFASLGGDDGSSRPQHIEAK